MTDTHTIIEMTQGTEEDRLFEGAFNSVLHTDKRDYPSYIGGMKVASGIEFLVSSPIDDTIRFGMFQEPEDDLADEAVDSALKAFRVWSDTEPGKRAEVFEVFLNNLKKQRYRVAAMVTLSSGMIRSRALEETDRLIEIIGREIGKVRAGFKGRPTGVWAIISEHNSPLAAPFGYAATAMLSGNTVVMMPSRYAPIPVYMMYDMLSPALPPGTLNVITDRRGKATMHLTENDDLAGIIAIGSGDRMEDMMFMQTDDKLRFINEVKGMNPVLVHKPHNMTQAVNSILDDAFSYSGQDISSCSKVIVLAEEQKEFINALMKACSGLKVGDPGDRDTVIGPIISKAQTESFLNIVDSCRNELIYGGDRVMNDNTEAGYYVRPAIMTGLHAEHDLNNIDRGLPILSVQIAEDADEAIEMLNTCDVGRFSGLYSKDERLIARFRSEAIAETTYVNDPGSVPKCALRCSMEEFVK